MLFVLDFRSTLGFNDSSSSLSTKTKMNRGNNNKELDKFKKTEFTLIPSV